MSFTLDGKANNDTTYPDYGLTGTPNDDSQNGEEKKKRGCCGCCSDCSCSGCATSLFGGVTWAFGLMFRTAPFGLRESPVTMIDVRRTFAPDPVMCNFTMKVFMFAWTLSTILYGSINVTNDGDRFYLAYLTHWGLIISGVYLLLSTVCMMLFKSEALQQPTSPLSQLRTKDKNGNIIRPSWVVRSTWFFAALALPLEVFVGIFYWILDYDGGVITYMTVMRHVAVPAMVLLDVIFINNVPIRLSHMPFLVIFAILYLAWLVAFEFLDIDNPTTDDPEEKEYIYEVLQFREHPLWSSLFAVGIVFVAVPAVFLFCWILSLFCPVLFQWNASRRRLWRELPISSSTEPATAESSPSGAVPNENVFANVYDHPLHSQQLTRADDEKRTFWATVS